MVPEQVAPEPPYAGRPPTPPAMVKVTVVISGGKVNEKVPGGYVWTIGSQTLAAAAGAALAATTTGAAQAAPRTRLRRRMSGLLTG